MRPEQIVVGEVRGGDALDMLQAMNTGHDGSLSTLHANSPRDVLSRIETLALMGGIDFPVKVIREQISSAIHLLVQQARLKDGSRKVTAITEMAGMEGDKIVLQEVFRFVEEGVDANGKIQGQLRPVGIRPRFMPKLEAVGSQTASIQRFLLRLDDGWNHQPGASDHARSMQSVRAAGRKRHRCGRRNSARAIPCRRGLQPTPIRHRAVPFRAEMDRNRTTTAHRRRRRRPSCGA